MREEEEEVGEKAVEEADKEDKKVEGEGKGWSRGKGNRDLATMSLPLSLHTIDKVGEKRR